MNSQITNAKTREWQALSRDHHLPPFTDYKQLNEKGARIITKAEGVYIWDSEGNKILDAMAGLWCVNVGYGREELVQAATRQMRELPFYNLFFQTAHPPAPAPRPTTPCCVWSATIGRPRASRRRKW